MYNEDLKNQQKVNNFNEIKQLIQREHPKYLYGIDDFVPLLAFETHTPILDGVYETNFRMFEKQLLDKTALTNKALTQKTLIIAHGAYYPELNIRNDIIDDFADVSLLKKSCTLIAGFSVYAEQRINRINVIKCYKDYPHNTH